MDLSFLRPLYSKPGTWCSVYLDTSRASEDAVAAVPLRWRALAGTLREQGADEPTLDALDRAVRADTGSPGLALFAASGAVALTVPLPEPPPRDLAVARPLPHVLPLAAQLGERVAWLRALVDRTGADLLAVPADGQPRTAHVGNGGYPVRKGAPGGWSQPGYQSAAEENWQRMAAQISQEAVELARQVHARVLLVAGDVRERALVADRLAEALPAARVVQTEAGSRAAGAAAAPLDKATQTVVREEARRRRDEVLDTYRQGRAATGLREVAYALGQGQVETLLVDAQRLPADAPHGTEDLLVRDAASTGADLLVVSPDEVPLTDGVGAVLRY